MQHHGRSQFFETFTDEILQTLVEASQSVMSPETIVSLRVLGGAMSRVAPDATAFHRDKQGMVLITLSHHHQLIPSVLLPAVSTFFRHCCLVLRMPPEQWPEPLNRTFKHLNSEIYVPLQGPSELGVKGKLLHWDCTADLAAIAVPTLVIGSRHDTMNPAHLE